MKTYLNFRNNLTMLYKNLGDGELEKVMRMRRFLDYLARLLGDNVKARRMLPDGGFVRAEQAGAVPVSVQQFYLDHPPQMRATERGKGRGWRLPELFRKRK